MNNFKFNLLYISIYTIFYHGLYYCPPLYNNFDNIIKICHGK